MLAGGTTDRNLRELIALAERKGWTQPDNKGIRIEGSTEWRRTVAIALLLKHTDTKVHGLKASDWQVVKTELEANLARHSIGILTLQPYLWVRRDA